MGASLSTRKAVADIAKATGEKAELIEPKYRDLLKKHPSGYLPNNFFDYCTELAELIFSFVDTNNDGRLHISEYLVFLIIFCSPSQDQQLKGMFRLFDMDGDERITFAEVTKIFAATDKMSRRQFNQQRARDFFNKLDANRDGHLTREEFIIGAKNCDQIMQVLTKIKSLLVGLG